MKKKPTPKKKAPRKKVYKYVAQRRRSEAGVGIVERGEKVELGAKLDDEAVARLVHQGHYEPVGAVDPKISALLEEFTSG